MERLLLFLGRLFLFSGNDEPVSLDGDIEVLRIDPRYSARIVTSLSVSATSSDGDQALRPPKASLLGQSRSRKKLSNQLVHFQAELIDGGNRRSAIFSALAFPRNETHSKPPTSPRHCRAGNKTPEFRRTMGLLVRYVRFAAARSDSGTRLF